MEIDIPVCIRSRAAYTKMLMKYPEVHIHSLAPYDGKETVGGYGNRPYKYQAVITTDMNTSQLCYWLDEKLPSWRGDTIWFI
jgi:hypothetical protein